MTSPQNRRLLIAIVLVFTLACLLAVYANWPEKTPVWNAYGKYSELVMTVYAKDEKDARLEVIKKCARMPDDDLTCQSWIDGGYVMERVTQ